NTRKMFGKSPSETSGRPRAVVQPAPSKTRRKIKHCAKYNFQILLLAFSYSLFSCVSCVSWTILSHEFVVRTFSRYFVVIEVRFVDESPIGGTAVPGGEGCRSKSPCRSSARRWRPA